VANAINNNLKSLLNWFELVSVFVEYTTQATYGIKLYMVRRKKKTGAGL
jgi:hypothetical protein